MRDFSSILYFNSINFLQFYFNLAVKLQMCCVISQCHGYAIPNSILLPRTLVGPGKGLKFACWNFSISELKQYLLGQ